MRKVDTSAVARSSDDGILQTHRSRFQTVVEHTLGEPFSIQKGSYSQEK